MSRLRYVPHRKKAFPKRKITFIFLVFFFLIGGSVLYFSGAYSICENWFFSAMTRFCTEQELVVNNILVEGRHNIKQKDLLQIIDVKVGDPLPFVAINDIQKRLENHSWVKQAVVERRYPDVLIVRLVERAPVALWQFNQKLYAIGQDDTAMPIEAREEFPGLFFVVGPEANKNAVKLIQALKKYPRIKEKVKYATCIGGRRWDLHFINGIAIRLPEDYQREALDRINDLLHKKVLDRENIETLDLRINKRFIIKYKNNTNKLKK